MPEALKQLARDVLAQVRASYRALASRDVAAARAVIAGDNAIDVQYRALRKQFKAGLGQYPEQLNAWLKLMNTGATSNGSPTTPPASRGPWFISRRGSSSATRLRDAPRTDEVLRGL